MKADAIPSKQPSLRVVSHLQPKRERLAHWHAYHGAVSIMRAGKLEVPE